MAHYDVLVVGAGPAGNAAAYALTKGGANVALLEKQTLPRHKTCGGGMSITTGVALDLDAYPNLDTSTFVEQKVTWMRHTFHFQDACLHPVNRNAEEPPLSLWMVQRSIFDNALTERAVRAGATLIQGAALKEITQEADGRLRIQAEGKHGEWTATADYILGADGANGIVAKLAGLRQKRTMGIAMEAEVPHNWGDGHPDLRPEVIHLEYGAVPRGYAWVFPKQSHINVGAGVFQQRRTEGRGDKNIKDLLQSSIQSYLHTLQLPIPDDITYHAHPIPVWEGLDTIVTKNHRIMLLGDSAGLVQPLFGDGILHAIKSGNFAAQAILEGKPQTYADAVQKEFKADFNGAARVAELFHQFPSLCYHYGVKHPDATYWAARLMAGEVPFHSVQSRLMKRLRRAILKAPKPREEMPTPNISDTKP